MCNWRLFKITSTLLKIFIYIILYYIILYYEACVMNVNKIQVIYLYVIL